MRVLRRGAALTFVAVLVGAGLAGCGGSDGGGSGDDVVPEATIPVTSSSGDECTDPAGDLDRPVGVSADTAGLAGIDLVSASAAVAGEQLDVTITAAGPIDDAPAATYVVAQGDPLGALSFELRMAHGSDGWRTTLITWPKAVETRAQMTITPVVDGDTLTVTVPLDSLPPIALAMQFGASAQVGDALVIDDCSSLAS